jgi:hypothetical protein
VRIYVSGLAPGGCVSTVEDRTELITNIVTVDYYFQGNRRDDLFQDDAPEPLVADVLFSPCITRL